MNPEQSEAEKRLQERTTELYAACEEAEQAIRSGDAQRMRAALTRLAFSRRAAKQVAQ